MLPGHLPVSFSDKTSGSLPHFPYTEQYVPSDSAATDLFTTIPFVSGVGHLNLNLGTEYALNISIGTVTLDGTIKIEEEGSNLKLTAIQNSEPTKPYYYIT